MSAEALVPPPSSDDPKPEKVPTGIARHYQGGNFYHYGEAAAFDAFIAAHLAQTYWAFLIRLCKHLPRKEGVGVPGVTFPVGLAQIERDVDLSRRRIQEVRTALRTIGLQWSTASSTRPSEYDLRGLIQFGLDLAEGKVSLPAHLQKAEASDRQLAQRKRVGWSRASEETGGGTTGRTRCGQSYQVRPVVSGTAGRTTPGAAGRTPPSTTRRTPRCGPSYQVVRPVAHPIPENINNSDKLEPARIPRSILEGIREGTKTSSDAGGPDDDNPGAFSPTTGEEGGVVRRSMTSNLEGQDEPPSQPTVSPAGRPTTSQVNSPEPPTAQVPQADVAVVVAPPSSLADHCLQLACEAACRLRRYETGGEPAAEPFWFGRQAAGRSTREAVAAAVADLVRQGCRPEPIFALVPYFVGGALMDLAAVLGKEAVNTVRQVLDAVGEEGGHELHFLFSDLLDAADPGTGQLARAFEPEEMRAWSIAALTRRELLLRRYPDLKGYWRAMHAQWSSLDREVKGRRRGKGVVKPAFWDLVSGRFDDRSEKSDSQPTPLRDEWTAIREFLGMRDDTRFSTGWIAAGWSLNRGHEAQAMQASVRRVNPLTGTAIDVIQTDGLWYTTVDRANHMARVHHYDVAPKGALIVRVTPDNFAEFRDDWHKDLRKVAPTYDVYARYGDQRSHLKGRDEPFFGKTVKWR